MAMVRGLPAIDKGSVVRTGTCTLSNGAQFALTKTFSAKHGTYYVGASIASGNQNAAPEIATVVYHFDPRKPEIGIKIQSSFNENFKESDLQRLETLQSEFSGHLINFVAGSNTVTYYKSHEWQSQLQRNGITVYDL
jgi:hypothetical protein